ncbi:hypothetical protein CHCC14814_1304 [Bacillus paralicheniformis]|nr:hypothetical protein CHCC14814_1304 [Bacillus paralicheniformis]
MKIYPVKKLRNEELFIQVKADSGEFNVILEASAHVQL